MNKVVGKITSNNNLNVHLGAGAKIKATILGAGAKGEPGTTNYIELENIPTIGMVELKGNKDLLELGAESIQGNEIKNLF